MQNRLILLIVALGGVVILLKPWLGAQVYDYISWIVFLVIVVTALMLTIAQQWYRRHRDK